MLELVLTLGRFEFDLLTVQDLIRWLLVLRIVRTGRYLYRLVVSLRTGGIAVISRRDGRRAMKTNRGEIRRISLDLIDGRCRRVDVCLVGILLLLLLLQTGDHVTVPVVVRCLLIRGAAGLHQLCGGGSGDGLLLLITARLNVKSRDIVVRCVIRVPTTQQAQRLWHHRMNLRRGRLIDLRLDGETRRHARHRFLMGSLQISVILRLSDRRYSDPEIRRRDDRRRAGYVVLLLLAPAAILMLLLLLRLRLLLLMALVNTKTL